MLKKYHKLIFIFIFLIILNNLFSDETSDKTSDLTTDKIKEIDPKYKKRILALIEDDFNPDEKVKKSPLLFDAGFSLSTTSRILFKTFQPANPNGFEPVPNDQWYADLNAKLWSKLVFDKGRFLLLSAQGLFIAERKKYELERNIIYPLFNIDEFYLHWDYRIGKLILGRSNYNLMSGLVFNGPLDGVEIDINVPFFNFKTFVGFTGFLGIFNPWFNPYRVTSLDGSYQEESNMIYSNVILKLNAEQARRIFFGSDFDIHIFNQHFNPYLLIQMDLTSLFYKLNTDFDVNTFHFGYNQEGRIAKNFYYKINLAGLFGTHPTSTSGVFAPIIACAVDSKLRYTIDKAKYLTFILGYAFGTGNYEEKGKWSEYDSDKNKGFWSDKFDGNSNNKFYYFGKFDGGFVLNPVLSNIHSISFKILISPVHKGSLHLTLYTAFYQTFKFWSSGPISDIACDNNDYIVGSELDFGLLINTGSNFYFAFDIGSFKPLSAYSNNDFRFKAGVTLGLTF